MKQNQYEITYLVDPNASEETRGSLQSAVDEHIASLEGSVAASAPTLRRTLAYPIAKKTSAFMRVMNVDLDPAKILELQQFLKKAEGVMRVTIIATLPRTRMSQEILEKHGRRTSKDKHRGNGRPEKAEKKDATPEKEVTMQDVEKGIEEALTEEVK